MIVTIEGLDIEVSTDTVTVTGIEHGDLYVAKRNGDWQLLTFSQWLDGLWHTAPTSAPWLGCLVPRELAYPFNTGECHKVVA